jgi:hypothetical protein
MGVNAPAEAIPLIEVGRDHVHNVTPKRLTIAGFTGRDRQAVEDHITELRRLGVPAPDVSPSFYECDPGLLTTSDEIGVVGGQTSGEVEAVLVQCGHTLLLTVGSDHTDRELERTSIPEAKRACPKVIGRECVPVASIKDWDSVVLESWIDGQNNPYQSGTLSQLLPLQDILRLASDGRDDFGPGDFMFLGTLPVRGGELRPSSRFAGQLRIPGLDLSMRVEYRVKVESQEAVDGQA